MSTTTASRPSTASVVAGLIWAIALPAVGSLSLATAWGGWRMPLLLLAATVLPYVLLLAALRLGVSRWAGTAVMVLLLVLVAYVLGAEAGTTLGGTVRDALPRLLTEPQPLALRADLIVAPVLLCGLVGMFTALRARRTTRVAPVLGAVVLYAAGALLTAGDGDRVGVIAALLVVLTVIGWVSLDDNDQPRRQRIVLIGPVLVVLVGLIASASLVPAQRSFDARTLVDPPLVSAELPSPLPQLAAWGNNPDVPLFSTSGDTAPLRLVVLDDYDGVQWRAATRYGPLGTTSGTGMPPGRDRRSFTTAVRIEGLGGNWLPSPGDPVGVAALAADTTDETSEVVGASETASPAPAPQEVLVDTRTGTLFSPDPVEGLAYEVTGVVDAPEPADLPAASVPGEASDDVPLERYLAVPDMPYALHEYGRQVTAGARNPLQRALLLEAAVRGSRTLDPAAISGSALWRIQGFLIGADGEPGAQAGSSEQFATAFAVLARDQGLPTRLVVGFLPGAEQADGTRIVRGGDALAWPEVYFDELGWVPFSPTPEEAGEAEDGESDNPVTPPTDPEPEQPDDSESAQGTEAPDADAAEVDRDERGLAWSVDPRLLAAAVAAALLLALLLARAVRSARHRARGARGAWAEVVDGLRLVGQPPARGESATQVAERVRRRYDVEQVAALAADAERAAYAPDGSADPASTRRDLRVVRRALRRSLPWWRRWSWPLSPRVWRTGRRPRRATSTARGSRRTIRRA